MKIAIGNMVSFHMQLHALDTGTAGMVPLPFNNVHSLYFTMMPFMLVTGPTMFKTVKNTVSNFLFCFVFQTS